MQRMLSELVPNIPVHGDVAICGLTDDSRKVKPGYLFLASSGQTLDGRAFIEDAISGAASAVLCEPPTPQIDTSVPIIAIDGLGKMKGEIASRWFGEPSKHMTVVAVTGTNGKTSCSHFVSRILSLLGKPCGIVGTLGYGLPGAMSSPGLTTPGAIDLQSSLDQLAKAGCSAVCIEASSHGLDQGRLEGTSIDVSVFTNLTRDHMDYHHTVAHYKAAKQRLFHWPHLKAAVINVDDEFGKTLVANMSAGVQVITYSARADGAGIADIYCQGLSFEPDGFSAQVLSPWGSGSVSSRLLGMFNVSNLLAAIGVAGLLEYDFDDIAAAASQVETVPGRMDVLEKDGFPLVIVDYAHTPDALEKALVAARQHCKGRLVCVAGCGGDRDKGKRPLMGKIMARFSDACVVTSDNPRSEDPESIIKQILADIEDTTTVRTEPDRARAIEIAISSATADDIVLIAGKGHETWQEVDGRREPFSDYDEVERIFKGGVARLASPQVVDKVDRT